MHVDLSRPLTSGPPLSTDSRLLARVGKGHAGAALFGVAMGAVQTGWRPMLEWALLLPLVLAATWLVCLPALYIPWAGRNEEVRLAPVVRAAAASFVTTGSCLGATAPIVWFFAATAPASPVAATLGFIFAWVALVVSGVSFARALKEDAQPLPGPAVLCFFALFGITFFQFCAVAALGWF